MLLTVKEKGKKEKIVSKLFFKKAMNDEQKQCQGFFFLKWHSFSIY